MEFSDYQEKATVTAIYPSSVRVVLEKLRRNGFNEEADMVERAMSSVTLDGNINYAALGLAGEAGEICNKIKKIDRDKKGLITDDERDDMKKELGDVLWYMSALASEFGISLDEIAKKNIEKLYSRMNRGVLSGSGDDR